MAVEALTSGGGSDDGGLLDFIRNKGAKKVAGKVAAKGAIMGAAVKGAVGTTAKVGAKVAGGVVAGVGLLASALGEGAFQLRKFGKGLEEGAKKNYEEKWWTDPRKPVDWLLYQGARFINHSLNGLGVLLDIVGAPFRYAIELINFGIMAILGDTKGMARQRKNLAKFDARVREGIRQLLNVATLGFGFKEKGSFGNLFGDEAATKEMVKKMQEGGGVTPGRKPVTRTIEKTKKKPKKFFLKKPTRRTVKEPPKGSGGNGESDRAWWDFLGWAGTGNQVIDKQTQELTDKVTDVGNTLGRDDYFGPLLRSTSKIILDQEITSSDVRNVGLGINYLIAQGLQKGRIERALKAYSEGGDVSSLIGGLDVTSWVEDTFRKTAKASIRTPNLNMSTGTSTGTPGTGTTPSPGSSTSSSGTPFSGNMKGAQIGEQHLLDAMKKYNYTGDPAALMAIVKGESSFQAKEEDMYVSAERAYEIFGPKGGNRITSVQHAQELIDAGKEAFFNHVYQPKYVPMNEQPGDGYRYIGRGHIQLTGRSNYRDIGEIIGRNLEEDPLQILNNPTVSAEAAVGFMLRAQKYGQDVNSIEGALKAVGGSQTSWPDKRKYYQEYQKKIQSGQLGKNTPATPNVQPGQPGSSQPASSNIPPNISSGTGGKKERDPAKTKIAGDLGRYIYKTLTPQAKASDGVGDFSYASEHPDFGGSFKRSYDSWHNYDRAIDIGGFWPQDQTKILAKVLEFNEKHGVTPVELLYGKPGTPLASTHGDHVHVAYEKGGMTLGKPHLALIGEKGKEIVIDNDSSVAEVTPMLLAINAAKDKQGVLDAIRDYAPYDERSNQVVIVDDSDSMNMQDTGDQGGSTMILPLGGTSYDNSFDFLDYQGLSLIHI